MDECPPLTVFIPHKKTPTNTKPNIRSVVYMVTSIPPPTPQLTHTTHLPPTGLEDQLLNTLILSEKQDLEQQRLKMVEEVAMYRKRIRQLEDDLLFRLSNSKGNLLDDAQLIDVLAGALLAFGGIHVCVFGRDCFERGVHCVDLHRCCVTCCCCCCCCYVTCFLYPN